jgi:OFA family oxalate/formate antiporter-like MFS transporter
MRSRGPIVVAAALATQLALGSLYAWSGFAAELKQHYGLSASQASSVMGWAIMTFTLIMIPAGRAMTRVGPRPMALLGSSVFALGYLISSFANGSYPVILFGAGILVGAGIGLAYTAPISACLAWYPNRKGLMTGLAVTGFGAGALLLSSLVEWLVTRGWDVHSILRSVAVLNGAVAILGSASLSLPPSGGAVHKSDQVLQVEFSRALRTTIFWASVAGMFCATFAGLLIVGNLKMLGMSVGLHGNVAGTAVGIFAIGNASGRLIWGLVYDRLRASSLPLALFAQTAALVAITLAREPLPFTFAAFAIGFFFGSSFVLYAADLATEFGPQAVGILYPWVFLAYGVAGLIGPYVGGKIYDIAGSYEWACYGAAAVTLIGGGLILVLRRELFRAVMPSRIANGLDESN